MGSNQSAETRSVSMDNPTPSGVIDVSDEVVQRLKLGISKVQQEEALKARVVQAEPEAKPEKPPSKEAAVPIKPTHSIPKTSASSSPMGHRPSAIAVSAAAATAAQPPYPKYSGEPTVTSMELRRQKEIELRENDIFWKNRIAQLEANITKTNAVMEKEYKAAIDDVHKRFAAGTGIYQPPPCQEAKARVIACYRQNPGETLRCSQEVAMFTNCVANTRITRLDSATQVQKPVAKAA